ncbi:MAG: phage major capsid protein [Candidatus Paceibacterota bacterium]
MDEKEFLEKMQSQLKGVVDEAFIKQLPGIVGPMVAIQVSNAVKAMRAEKEMYGFDRTGLSNEEKKDFARCVIKSFESKEKAEEAFIPEIGTRGGILIPPRTADAILRIAASVGLVLSQATKWNMKGTNELGIPNYLGSSLLGEYVGIDKEGGVTGFKFGEAKLLSKLWQLTFVLNKNLLKEASVNLAEWLLALAGESLANMIDYQAFTGSGNPFVGILNDDNVAPKTLSTGKNAFDKFHVIEDASRVSACLDESILDGAAWYVHRSVWAEWRIQKDSGTGMYYLANAGAPSSPLLANYPLGGGVKPVGEMAGLPVFTCKHLPGMTDSGASKKFAVLGNMKAFAYGDKGEMESNIFTSGNFGDKEIARSNQNAIVINNEHSLVNALPNAFVAIKTAS